MEKMENLFEKHDDEYLKFERVENKLNSRPDIHAFILLNNLFPRERKMLSAAGRDEIFLDVEYKEIERLTEEQVIELRRCGVHYSEESLAMFV